MCSSKETAKAEELPQIKELSATPSNRDVRVHDGLDVDSWDMDSAEPAPPIQPPTYHYRDRDDPPEDGAGCMAAAWLCNDPNRIR